MDSDFPSRCGSSMSLASQGTSYSSLLGEDLSEVIANASFDEEYITSERQPAKIAVELGKRKRTEEHFYRSPRFRPGPTVVTLSPPGASDSSTLTASTITEIPEYEVPVVIAHSFRLSPFISRLPWGAQWEIARFVSTNDFRYDSLTIPELSQLCTIGTNATAAPEVAKLVRSKCRTAEKLDAFTAMYAQERAARLPWEELDHEESVLNSSPYGGLGCNEDEDFCAGHPDWYGGRIHFTAKYTTTGSETNPRLILDRPSLGSSNRFTRRFGSRRFIRVRVQKDHTGSRAIDYFRRPFIISGRVFRAFFAKEQTVFLFQTNEIIDRTHSGWRAIASPSSARANPRDCSLLDFITWHNNLILNDGQTMVKWAARFALGTSNSVPGVRLEPDSIRFVDDIVCDGYSGKGKVPSEMIMTDGCGFANRALLQSLQAKFRWPIEPTAVQIRIGGAKGLLLLHLDRVADHDGSSEVPTIWLRPSQTKIKHSHLPLSQCLLPKESDPAILTVDVLRASRLTSPARLSVETIVNLAENGVPFKVFVTLLTESMRTKAESFLQFDGPDGDLLLWANVAREGGVISARLAREVAGAARAHGYTFEDATEEDGDDDDLEQLDKALQERSTAWWADQISGCPSSLEETCMVLLDAGFMPKTCPVLAAKLKEVAKKSIRSFATRFRIVVPMSCSAFIVPDPYGVLGPNEVHIRSSSRNLVDQEGRPTDLVLGEVLVTRHPCKVPTDVQKVKAVFHERLRHLYNVIVISTKNHIHQGKPLNRHLASMTGGGDYDGDTMEVFWQPEIVHNFKNADPTRFAVEPPSVQHSLVKNTETVAEFLIRVPESAPAETQMYELQKYLLGALQDTSIVGTYSTWWENTIYKLGYAHEQTIFLAYMFCAVLDGSKTGVSVDRRTLESHRKQYAHRPPSWKETSEELKRKCFLESNEPNLKRSKELPRFIMDELRNVVERESSNLLSNIEKKLGIKAVLDAHLAAPWLDAVERAEQLARKHGNGIMKDELKEIKDHVQAMHTMWSVRGGGKESNNPGKGKATFTAHSIEKRQDVLRELSRKFDEGPRDDFLCFDQDAVRRLKASYAYKFDFDTAFSHWSRFPWDLAMRPLCEIKAKALGSSKTVTQRFYDKMTLSSSVLNRLGKF